MPRPTPYSARPPASIRSTTAAIAGETTAKSSAIDDAGTASGCCSSAMTQPERSSAAARTDVALTSATTTTPPSRLRPILSAGRPGRRRVADALDQPAVQKHAEPSDDRRSAQAGFGDESGTGHMPLAAQESQQMSISVAEAVDPRRWAGPRFLDDVPHQLRSVPRLARPVLRAASRWRARARCTHRCVRSEP